MESGQNLLLAASEIHTQLTELSKIEEILRAPDKMWRKRNRNFDYLAQTNDFLETVFSVEKIETIKDTDRVEISG